MNTVFFKGKLECDARVVGDGDKPFYESVMVVVNDEEELRFPVKVPRPYMTDGELEKMKAGASVQFNGHMEIGDYLNQVNQAYHGLGIVSTNLMVLNVER